MLISPPYTTILKYGIFCLILCSSFSLSAQAPQRCGTDTKMEELFRKNPKSLQQIEESFRAFNTNRKQHVSRRMSSEIIVHVIIVHSPGLSEGTGNNLSIDRIESQIQVLTDDFTRQNDDANDTPAQFPAASADIEFCLGGVTRYASDSGITNSNEYQIKDDTRWDSSEYLNIWVSHSLPGGLLGWASFPIPTPDPVEDGVVVLTGSFGGGSNPGTFIPYHLGRTATHEVGHYLGLRHIWGPNNSGCGSNDDGFSDTPLQFQSNGGCPNHPSPSCGNAGDMFMNYMDYVNDNCMNAFSEDQADYMNSILSNQRSSLLNTNCNFISGIDIELIDFEDVTCPGGSDGIIEVEAIDGTPPFTYTILETGDSNTVGYFDGLEEGDYTFIVEDSNGSTAEIELEVNEPNDFFTNVTIINAISCIGAADGEVYIAVSGGNGFYDFDVPGQGLMPEDDIENLEAGEYIVTIIDSEGCETFVDFELDPPDSLHLLVDTLINVGCYGGNDGSIEIEGTGGTGFIDTYQVLDDGTTIEDTLFIGLAQDTFTFVAEDFNGCTDTSLIVMNQPDSLQLMLDTLIPPTCFGESSAVLIMDPVGGNTTFTYMYETFTVANDTISGLSADTFLITAIDEKNCMDTTSFIIINPDANEILIDELINAECGGSTLGSVALSNTSEHMPSYTIGSETNESGIFTSLSEGDYAVNAVDTFGCQSVLEFSIATSGGVEVEISSLQNLECAGEDDGSFTLEATGGSGYSYSIDGVNFQDENTFSNLGAGEYTAYVQDADMCVTEEVVIISSPDPLMLLLIDKTDNTCFGESEGEAQVEFEGGSGEITFFLNNVETPLELTDLSADTYTLEAIDENDCSTTIEFTIQEPSQIEVTSFSSTLSTCLEDTGTLSVEAIGGTGVLTYTLNGDSESTGEFTELSSQIYTVIIEDETGCSIEQAIEVEQAADIELIINSVNDESCVGESDGQIDIVFIGGSGSVTLTLNQEVISVNDLNNLEPGNYTLSVEDEEGCSDFEMLTIVEATPLSLSLMSSENITCNGGSNGKIIVAADGGAGNYIYSIGSDSNFDGVFTNLDNTDYEVMVMDQNGCNTSLPLTLEMPEAIEFGLYESIAPKCFGENDAVVDLTAIGGDGNYTFTINGITDVDGMIDNLSAGTYDVSITDGNGCEGIGEIIIEDGTQVELNIVNQTAPSCKGNNDASVMLVANDGNGAYTYTIDGDSNTTGLFENLAFGNYIAVVSNESDCTQEIEITIEDGVELEYTFEAFPTRCANEGSGIAMVSALNGNPPYVYTLGTQTNSDGVFENLTAGDYSVEIKDASDCQAEVQLSIGDTESIIVSNINTVSTICHNTATGAFSLDIEGGSGDYMIVVDGQVIEGTDASSLSAGDYLIIVSDGNGCSISQSITIDDAPLLELIVISEDSPRCADESNGQVEVSGSGGTGPYEYTMGMETNTTGIFQNLTGSNYQIQVTDLNGCEASYLGSLEDPQPLAIGVITADVSCAGGNDGGATIVSSGGTGTLIYSIENGESQLGQQFGGLSANTYNAIITDNNGCELTSEFIIESPTEIDTQSVSVTSIDINQGTPGEIVIEAKGGIEPYTYSIDGIDYQSGNTFEIEEAGIQAVSIQDDNDCIRTFNILVDYTTLCGGATINQVSDVSINPNPVTNLVNLSFCNSGEQSIGFTIYDDQGRFIYEFFKDYDPGAVEARIDVSNYPVGIYIVGITSDTRTIHYRFAKID